MGRGDKNRYIRIIERIFEDYYQKGTYSFEFKREDIDRITEELGVERIKNFGDLIYSFRYRAELPEWIQDLAPRGKYWIIMPAGRGQYRFEVTAISRIVPTPGLAETKIPDATPGIIAKYSLSDEQALLTKVRYNRLVDIFTGVTCYALQSHLRATVTGFGQVETDDIYVGVDKRGAHYVFPIQAKGGSDTLNIVQIIQDFGVCAEKFASLICRPIASQFMEDDLIALFEFQKGSDGIAISAEKHYRLVPPEKVTTEDLENYRHRSP